MIPPTLLSRLWWLFCFAIALPAPLANAEDSLPLVISQDHALPPLAFQDPRGKPQGLLVDLWRALGKQMGRPVTFRLVDWPQTLRQVRDGTVPVHGGLFPSPERAKFLDFSKPLAPLETVLFISADSRARSLRDPKLQPIGVVEDSYEQEYLREQYPDLPLREYVNNRNLVAAAAAGQVPAFAADYPVGLYLLDQFTSPDRFHVLEVLYKQQLVAAVPRGKRALLNEINAAITSLPDAERTRITNRWLHTQTVEVTPHWVVPTVLAIALLLLMVFLGVYLHTLRRERSLLSTQLQERTRDLVVQGEQFQALFDNAAMSVMVHDRDTAEVIQANPRALEKNGVEDVAALNQKVFGPSPLWVESPYALSDLYDWFARAREQGAQHFEWRTRCRDGTEYWDEVFLQPVQIGDKPCILSSTIDITTRKRAEADLQQQMQLEELVRRVSLILLQREPDGVARAMAELGEFMRACRCTQFNFVPENHGFNLQQQWCADGIRPRKPDTHIPGVAVSPYLHTLASGEALAKNYDPDNSILLERILFAAGNIASILALPILREGSLTGVLIFSFAEPKRQWSQIDLKLLHVAADLIGNALVRQELEQELERQASHDSLTGLYNRRKFEDLLLQELGRADRYQRSVAVILLDVDHFKAVNDRHGHDIGDEVLCQLSAALREKMRDSDILARWGGEEFIILLPETDFDAALHAADSLRRDIANTRFPTVGQLTLSLGVSAYQHDETLDSLIKRADDALYQAKEAGRNRIRPHPPER